MAEETSLPPPLHDEEVAAWLAARLHEGQPYLLAHADDGVIWGKLVDGQLVTSRDAAAPAAREISPPLRGITLQQAFVFGLQGEMRLWRDGTGWQFHKCTTADEQSFAAMQDEWQVLWGTKVRFSAETQHGFTHLREARQQGLDHIVPLAVSEQDLSARRLRLHIRHFIERDPDTGAARIAFSRLVNLVVQGEEQ